MKTLVTGGSGFIGSNLVRLLLDKKHKVRVLDNLSSGHKKNIDNLDVEFIYGDIRNQDVVDYATDDIDIIFHLAASVGRQKSIDNPQEDSSINIIGTLNIIEAMKRRKIPKIVFSSSAAVYGELLTTVIDENHELNPDSPYGVSKLAAEKHLLAAAEIFGFKAVCLRYFNVYGKNQRYDAYGNVIPIFANNLSKNKDIIIFGDGEQTRDFVNVKDVALANYLSATIEQDTNIFNIGSGNTITINDLAKKMCEFHGLDVKVNYAPKRAGDVIHCKADIAKINKRLGFTPGKNLEEELLEYLTWFNDDITT